MPNDLRAELKARIDKAQEEISKLEEERRKYDEQITQIDSRLKVWREALQIEAEHWGEPSLPLFSGAAQPYRFAGMKLIDAVESLRKEQPSITKKQIREILERNSFDFHGKRPGTAIHFVWIALERRKRKSQ
jgi:chromosome segregation ATPase